MLNDTDALVLLAMGPAMPLGGQMVVCLITLGMVGALVRLIRGGPFRVQSIWNAVICSLATLIVLDSIIPRWPSSLYSTLSCLVGGICAALFLRPDSTLDARPRQARPALLFVVALFSGPVMGALLALLLIYVSDTPPIDRDAVITPFLVIGTIAGFLTAGFVGVIGISSYRGRR